MFSYRTSRWYVLAPLMAASAVGVVAARRPQPASGCASMAAWVNSNAASLPTTYAEILRYPSRFRKAIQTKLSPAVRRQLWHAQYHVYMESGILDAKQYEFVKAADDAIDELLGDKTMPSRRQQLGDSLERVAVVVLGSDLTHHIMYSLGPDDGGTITIDGVDRTPTLFRFASAHPATVPAIYDNCDCHWMGGGISPPECMPSAKCNDRDCTANGIQEGGCGPNGAYSCNALCTGISQ